MATQHWLLALSLFVCFSASQRVSFRTLDQQHRSVGEGENGEGEGEAENFQILMLSDIHFDPLANPLIYDANPYCRPHLTTRTSTLITRGLLDEEEEEDEKKRLYAIEQHKKQREGRSEPASLYGKVGCDTPLTLLNALVTRLQEATDPKWIFISGDTSAHKLTQFPGASALAIQTVTQALEVAFPSTPIYFALGNNDVDLTDYVFSCGPNNAWFEFLYSIWKRQIPADQKDTFLQMGAYSVSLNRQLRLIVLNTVLYSINDAPHIGDEDPCGQFAWFQAQLIQAKKANQKVYILGHILPGIDSFSYTPLWAETHNAKFIEITTKFRAIISGQLYGHLHHDEFRVFDSPSDADESQMTSNLATSAISPIFGNNPDYRVLRYGEDYRFKDYEVTLLLLDESNTAQSPVWTTLYRYLDTYKTPSATTKGLYKVYEQLGVDQDAFTAWSSYRQGKPLGPTPTLHSVAWVCERCVIVSIDSTSFASCIAQEGVMLDQCKQVH